MKTDSGQSLDAVIKVTLGMATSNVGELISGPSVPTSEPICCSCAPRRSSAEVVVQYFRSPSPTLEVWVDF